MGGLERSAQDATTVGSTWIDGSVGHGNWLYAIGSKSTHARGIPSYDSTPSVVELWIRIPDGAVTTVDMGTATTANVTAFRRNNLFIFASATNVVGTTYSPYSRNNNYSKDQAKYEEKITEYGKGKAWYKKVLRVDKG